MNIALISPNKRAYSETFITAHKEMLKGNVYYYYGNGFPAFLKNKPLRIPLLQKFFQIFKRKLKLHKFSIQQFTFAKSLKEHNIEVVLAESGVLGTIVADVCRCLKIPLIVHFHGMDASVDKLIKANDNYKKVFEVATYVIVVSKKMYQDLLQLGCPKERLVYNVYGPRDDFFDVVPQFNKNQFIAIGRFVNKKAPYYLILSFIEVLERFPDAILIIAGEGELLGMCKNLSRFYGLQKNIIFPGVISPEEFREYLAESLAFVQHSVKADNGDTEGTPVAILEASAAGLPVISTLHAGIPDVIINGKTGLLVDEHDVQGMTANMLYILDNPKKAMEMGEKGRENIRDNFSLRRHIDVLDQLVASAGKSGPV